MSNNALKGLLIAFLNGIVCFIFILGFILYSVGRKDDGKTEENIRKMEKCTESMTVTVTHVNEYWEPIIDENGNRLDIDTNHRSKYEGSYKYTVDGKEYEGSKVSYGTIKEGQSLEIAYNPNDPSMHFLMDDIKSTKRLRERNGGGGFFTWAGLILMIIGFLMAVPLAIYNIVSRIKEKREHKRRMQEIDEMKKNM
ncbi:MAG: DUF3592 domain-containing protein [Lachnospiraceae bacterium]|nr:DUF3592 domain-containing protein [Lachnospiraceae bacterium]